MRLKISKFDKFLPNLINTENFRDGIGVGNRTSLTAVQWFEFEMEKPNSNRNGF